MALLNGIGKLNAFSHPDFPKQVERIILSNLKKFENQNKKFKSEIH